MQVASTATFAVCNVLMDKIFKFEPMPEFPPYTQVQGQELWPPRSSFFLSAAVVTSSPEGTSKYFRNSQLGS
jgi:hypothetical protein